MAKKVGVLRFPGTNCDEDVFKAVGEVGLKPEWLWHRDRFDAKDFTAFVIPGGFSYGDYLRCGALAALSPVMEDLKAAAEKGFPVLGICNGFQILCETKLLPGALVRNHKGRFMDAWVEVEVKNNSTKVASKQKQGERLKLPIAHGEGCYTIGAEDLKQIKDNGQIWLTYQSNPNGSMDDIAGVFNKNKNVAALMPHPERAMETWMGGSDGRNFFTSWLENQ